MSALRLRVAKASVLQQPTEFGAVVNIYPIPASKQEAKSGRQALRSVVVPVGPPGAAGASYKEVQLEPGRYRIEAALPSGGILQEEVTLPADAAPVEMQLREPEPRRPEPPPGWLGSEPSFPRGPSTTKDQDLIAKHPVELGMNNDEFIRCLVTVVSAPAIRPPDKPAVGITQAGGLAARGLFFALPRARKLKEGEHLMDIFSAADLSPRAMQRRDFIPSYRSERSLIYKFETDALVGEKGWDGNYHTSDFLRHYFVVSEDGFPPQYSVLPVPWVLPTWDRLAPVQAQVYFEEPSGEPSAGFDQGYRLSVAVGDDVIGSMLGYLGSGELVAAGSILKLARERLWYKEVNPLAATACAYVMIAAWEPGDADYWHKWVKNLMNWFPWLPDGAIQYAWVKMKVDRNPQTLVEARAALLEGYRRGLPFFSKGVSLLLDGLTLFRNDALAAGKEDREVEDALKLVRLMALRTNMRQVFTTVLMR